jgi:hypothetical protein
LLWASLLVAVAAGLVAGWAANRPPPQAPGGAPPPEDPGPVARAQSTQKEKEKVLLTLIQEQNAKPIDPGNPGAGLNYSLELGLLYLRDPSRLDDAELFFKELMDKKIPHYSALGKLGKAMVLAFKDQPEPSNRLFLSVLEKDRTQPRASHPFWKKDSSLREMMARALTFNYQNSPTTFPDELKPFLGPPAAVRMRGPGLAN